MLFIFVLFFASVLCADPCTEHLSSCRNCMSTNGCSFCATAVGLGQCVPKNGSLATICGVFSGQNQTTVISDIAQCKAPRAFAARH
jgi:hypothetical protein